MGLGLSRKIRLAKFKFLDCIKVYSITFYKILILIEGILKFFLKKVKKKTNIRFSDNLDKINQHEYKKTSQNNEDGIINYILTKINLKKINFVEIGFDFYENNSLELFKKTNKGLFIDSNYDKCFILKYIIKIFYFYKKITVLNSFVTKENINQLVNRHFSKDKNIDFLSIDVDGIDYFLLKEINFKPKIICIEYNFWFGKDLSISIPYSKSFIWKKGDVYSGASLLAINKVANKKGYYLVAIDSSCVNAFFIREDFKHLFKILDPILNFKTPKKYSDKDLLLVKNYLKLKKLEYIN